MHCETAKVRNLHTCFYTCNHTPVMKKNVTRLLKSPFTFHKALHAKNLTVYSIVNPFLHAHRNCLHITQSPNPDYNIQIHNWSAASRAKIIEVSTHKAHTSGFTLQFYSNWTITNTLQTILLLLPAHWTDCPSFLQHFQKTALANFRADEKIETFEKRYNTSD